MAMRCMSCGLTSRVVTAQTSQRLKSRLTDLRPAVHLCGPGESYPNFMSRGGTRMNDLFKNGLWLQFGAAIDALSDAINACPDELWGDNTRHMIFWYTAYHTLFWFDLYLGGSG